MNFFPVEGPPLPGSPASPDPGGWCFWAEQLGVGQEEEEGNKDRAVKNKVKQLPGHILHILADHPSFPPKHSIGKRCGKRKCPSHVFLWAHKWFCHLTCPAWWHIPGCVGSPSPQDLSVHLSKGSSSSGHYQVPGTILSMALDHLTLNESCKVGPLFDPTLKMNKLSLRGYKAFGRGHTGLTPKSRLLATELHCVLL